MTEEMLDLSVTAQTAVKEIIKGLLKNKTGKALINVRDKASGEIVWKIGVFSEIVLPNEEPTPEKKPAKKRKPVKK